MSGGKGGSQTSEVTVPQYIEDAARRNLSRADDISSMGYVPEYGPTVAAFTPMQQASAQNVSDTASAFGMAGGDMSQQNIMGGMDAPTEYAGGVRGYSSQPIYQGMVDELAAARPGQYDYINSFFIDPVTGQMGSQASPQSAPASMGTDLGGINRGGSSSNNNSHIDEAMAAARASYDASRGMPNTGMIAIPGYTTPASSSGSNPIRDFLTDATDGGGMGASGGPHKGLGVYSGIANLFGGNN